MRRSAWIGLLPGLALVLTGPMSTGAPAPDPTTSLMRTVEILTAPRLAGRGSGSPGGAAAADSIATWFAAAGLKPAFDAVWFQPFDLEGTGWHGQDLRGRQDRNVAGLLPGQGDLSTRYIVVGAHYDHLGRVDPKATDGPPARGAYYPGGNDNASGVAVLLEVARSLIDTDRQTDSGNRRSVLFVAFAAEEVGLQGSRQLVTEPPVALDRIDVLINLDTVGQLRDRRLYVGGVGTASSLSDLVAAANEDALDLVLSDGAWSGSDHMVFNTHEVPVLFLFTGAYLQYNRPTDDLSAVDPEGLTKVLDFTVRLAELARAEPGPFTRVAIAPSDLRPSGGNKDTWFGSLPDFGVDVQGYTLAGVFDDGPAARAGLQKGDVLIRLGGHEVTDLATFTVALRSFVPGQLVEVVVVRADRTLKFTVALGSRRERR